MTRAHFTWPEAQRKKFYLNLLQPNVLREMTSRVTLHLVKSAQCLGSEAGAAGGPCNGASRRPGAPSATARGAIASRSAPRVLRPNSTSVTASQAHTVFSSGNRRRARGS